MSRLRPVLAGLLSLAVAACQLFTGDPPAPALPAFSPGPDIPPASLTISPEPALPRRAEPAVPIDASHRYSLPELIDLAQRSHPDTRIAWERARQAALAVGLVEATWLPELSAEVLGGYQRTPVPIPKPLLPDGYFTANTVELLPSLVVKWLLFDFGQRDAQAEALRQRAAAARFGFTGSHQKLIFEVAKAYFALDAQRAERQVAETALASAKVLQEAAESRQGRGLATVMEVAQARRTTAKARFDLEQARAADNDAYHALLETIGLTPTLTLTIADSSGRALPRHLAGDADRNIRQALARRPDIVAALARLRASEAGIAAAEAAFGPTIALEGVVNRNIGSLNINGGPSYRVNEPAVGLLFRLKLPLYDGGSRRQALTIARSQRAIAEEELSRAQDEAVRQIARAQDALTSALAQFDAAQALDTAASLAASAALDAYRQGVGTFTAAVTAETDRDQARTTRVRAYAGALTAAAALAFVTGQLTSVDALAGPVVPGG